MPYTQLIADLGDQLPGLAIASRTVGSPQIRNRGTVGGNLGTSSPAGDGLPPLYACGAEVELASVDGTRRVPVGDFITGPKRNCLASDELIAAFWIKPADGPQEFSKVGTRNAMVIAVCSFALTISRERRAVTTCIGSAGPTPIRALDAEAFIAGVLDEENLWESPAPLAAERAHPLRRAGRAGRPPDRRRPRHRRVPLARAARARPARADARLEAPPGGGLAMKLSITVNGERREADGVWEGQSLLNALRDDLDLPGSKNACEQGECGSCSVYLDGTLVCSCLVLAAQADGRNVTTVEGIADGENLHAVQQAMVDAGAVQCGFCTPGFVVASHDLLSRNPSPTEPEIREALAGNLCRCTGYEKIIDAVKVASQTLTIVQRSAA